MTLDRGASRRGEAGTDLALVTHELPLHLVDRPGKAPREAPRNTTTARPTPTPPANPPRRSTETNRIPTTTDTRSHRGDTGATVTRTRTTRNTPSRGTPTMTAMEDPRKPRGNSKTEGATGVKAVAAAVRMTIARPGTKNPSRSRRLPNPNTGGALLQTLSL